MPYKKVMKHLGLGIKEAAAEEEDRREKKEKEKKKKGLQPHGRWQMSNKEFKELEETSR